MAEYRFVIYKGDVKLGSRYRLSGQPDVAAAVPSDVWSGAQAVAQQWTPASFTVMDVAVLENDELRIVEFNSVHSSGLYDINPVSFAELVEEWLRRLIESIDNPGSMLERQGLRPDKLPYVPHKLTVSLLLTQAPDLPQLRRWLDQRHDQLAAASLKKAKRNGTILGILLGMTWMH